MLFLSIRYESFSLQFFLFYGFSEEYKYAAKIRLSNKARFWIFFSVKLN